MNAADSPLASSSQPQEVAEELDRRAEPVDLEQPPRLAFPVVGVGATAGGLEAFGDLFKAMPVDGGTIAAHSAGLGKGATFHVILRIDESRSTPATAHTWPSRSTPTN